MRPIHVLVTVCSLLVAAMTPAMATPHKLVHSTRHHQRIDRQPAYDANGNVDNNLNEIARRYIGTNPTGWPADWCGKFMDFVLKKAGFRGGGNLASSYQHYGRRIQGPKIGAIAVMYRKGRAIGGSQGGHVGVVDGVDPNGNPILISGNHNHKVERAVYPRNRIIAYVEPN